MIDWAKIHLLEGRLRWWRGKFDYRHKKLGEYIAKVQNNRQHFPNHKQALKEAEAGAHKWGVLEGEAAKEIHALEAALHRLKPQPPPGPVGEGWSVPQTSWNPYRRKIANWIVRELVWAHAHGWNGYITSGLRTYAEQKYLWELYKYHGGNVAAEPGRSNHEGYTFPKGAIDTPGAQQLNGILNNKTGRKLLWAETHGLSDFVHFSGTGR